MDGIELLQELQGDQSQEEFAEAIGVGRSTVAMICLGKRRAGRQFLERLLKAYPERSQDIIRVFLPVDGLDCDSVVTDVEAAQ